MAVVLKRVAIGVGVVFLALQLVPYGRDHANPAVTQEAPWASADGRRLAEKACYDCHSNKTDWPWYSFVAPMSWLVQKDVDGGRDEVNFSEWDRRQESDDLADAVEDGSMPPRNYLLLHPGARLSDEEKAALIRELEALEDGGGGRGGAGRGGRGPG